MKINTYNTSIFGVMATPLLPFFSLGLRCSLGKGGAIQSEQLHKGQGRLSYLAFSADPTILHYAVFKNHRLRAPVAEGSSIFEIQP